MWNLPLVPFELMLLTSLLAYTAGLIGGVAIFFLASRIRRSEPHG